MFCKTCGVHMMSELNVSGEEFEKLPEEVRRWNEQKVAYRAVNVRMFNGVDVLGLKTKKEDGWGCLKPEYVNP
jgi:hypothetical protein